MHISWVNKTRSTKLGCVYLRNNVYTGAHKFSGLDICLKVYKSVANLEVTTHKNGKYSTRLFKSQKIGSVNQGYIARISKY